MLTHTYPIVILYENEEKEKGDLPFSAKNCKDRQICGKIFGRFLLLRGQKKDKRDIDMKYGKFRFPNPAVCDIFYRKGATRVFPDILEIFKEWRLMDGTVDSSALETVDTSALERFLKMSWGQLTVEKAISAVVLLVVCVAVIRLLASLLAKVLERTGMDQRVRRMVLRLVRTVLYIITGLMVAASLGIDVTSLIAMVSVFGLAVSLAVQDVLSNVAGGMVILFSKPFTLGDYISAGDGEGTVEAISLTHTKLNTFDGLQIMLPNSQMAAGKIVNFTVLGKRRVAHTVSASYEDSTEAVFAACRKAIAHTPYVLADPAPQVVLTKYGESAIEYSVRFWAPTDHYWDAYFACLEEIRRSFEADGVTMTYNHLNVHIVEDGK